MSTENFKGSVLDIFDAESSSNELKAGIHERVKLISIDPNPRKDMNGNIIKKQLFLKFKKFDRAGKDVGEIEISFFVVDPSRDTAIANLHTFIAQVKELLSLYMTSEEIAKSFDPIGCLVEADDERTDEELKNDFNYDNIKKKVLKKASLYVKIEEKVSELFNTLLKNKTGLDSESFRLRLEEGKDVKYVQIPRYDRFVEKESVSKEESAFYNNAK